MHFSHSGETAEAANVRLTGRGQDRSSPREMQAFRRRTDWSEEPSAGRRPQPQGVRVLRFRDKLPPSAG
jgi:hypothetical protein